MSGNAFDQRYVRRFEAGAGLDIDFGTWPGRVPAVAQVLRDGFGLRAESAGRIGAAELFRIRDSEPGIGKQLTVVRGGRPRWSYFLRADTMHQLYSYLDDNSGRSRDGFHRMSHGEGFLEILRTRVNEDGFYLMDEPDAPLSFTASLGLAALLPDLAACPSQVLIASHSPILAAIPGANLLELGAWGVRPATWDDLSLVIYWRQFLNNPQSFFRHLLADPDGTDPDVAQA